MEARWNTEPFLQLACDEMVRELDWGTLDSGRLHHAVSAARTIGGEAIVVAVLSDFSKLDEVLEDAENERRHENLPSAAPLWLYVPESMATEYSFPGHVILKKVKVK